MRKKEILEIPPLSCKALTKTLVAKVFDIAGIKHLIADAYCDGNWIMRYVVNQNDYIKYNPEKKVWTKRSGWNATLFRDYEARNIRSFRMSKNSKKAVEEVCGKPKNYNLNHGEHICDYIDDIKNKKNKIIEDKKKILRDKDMALFSQLPEGWDAWTEKYMVAYNIIKYKRKGNKTDYVCMNCNQSYQAVHSEDMFDGRLHRPVPVRNRHEKCACCGKYGKLENWGYFKPVNYHEHFGIFQNAGDKLLFRYFTVCRKEGDIYDDYGYRGHTDTQYESYRIVFDKNRVRKYTSWQYGNKSYWGMSNNSNNCSNIREFNLWKNNVLETSKYAYCNIDVYKKILNSHGNNSDLLNILVTYAKYPGIEILVKQGFYKLAKYLISLEGKTNIINKREKRMFRALRVRPEHVDILKNNYSYNNLIYYQKITQMNIYPAEQDESVLKAAYTTYCKESFDSILKYMTWKKAVNRLIKYNTEDKPIASVITRYSDYLKVKNELGYDMTNTVYLYPRDLKAAHDEAVAERERRRDERYIDRCLSKYSDISTRFESLEKKYKFETENLMIRPAHDAQEIILEGRTLHHCVGGENYLKKHSKGETAILFMREKDSIDIPLITIEVRNDVIIQWYGLNDTKPKDGPILDAIREFEEYIKKYAKKKAS